MASRPALGWALAAFAAVMIAFGWIEYFAPIVHTGFGLGLAPHGADAVVTHVVPGHSAARAGVHAGDIALLSQMSLSQRQRLRLGASPVGWQMTVPIQSGGAERTVVLQSQVTADPPELVATLTFWAILSTIALMILGLIAFRKPSLATAALVFYGTGALTSGRLSALFSWLPDPTYGIVTVIINALIGSLPALALLPFITRFPAPPTQKSGIVRMRWGDAIFCTAAVVYTFQSIYEPMLYRTWLAFNMWAQIVTVAIILAFAALAYADAGGEGRRRIGWVIAGFAVSAIASGLFNVADVYAPAATFGLIGDWAQALSLAFPIALAYAILRHRVIDVGFAVNRTVVYAIITTLIIAVVSLADWATSRLISGQRLAAAIEALVAIALGFALNWIHRGTERAVDRVVFRQRHLAEKRIEHRIDALDFSNSFDAVDEALAKDAPAILQLASGAAFRRFSGSEDFARTAEHGWAEGTVTTIGRDSLLVRTLLAKERAFFLDDLAIAVAGFPSGDAHPVLVVPIVSQHELIGFAVYGNHTDRTAPDPDEVALLSKLGHAAGTAYGAVEARQWRERAAALEHSLAPAR